MKTFECRGECDAVCRSALELPFASDARWLEPVVKRGVGSFVLQNKGWRAGVGHRRPFM